MRLSLLMARRFPPYGKWLGTAFARERHLCVAYETVAAAHNALALTRPLEPTVRSFFDRPFQVIDAVRFARALRSAIADPTLRDLPHTGAIDQFVDSTDALGDLRLPRRTVTRPSEGE